MQRQSITGHGPQLMQIRDVFPEPLLAAINRVAEKMGCEPYVTGGTVRDLLRGTVPHDLDITVAKGAHRFCRELIKELGTGTFVPLGTEDEEGGRVVTPGAAGPVDVDVSSFRGMSGTIDEDLSLRDFTINSMAFSLNSICSSDKDPGLLDPMNGLRDLAGGTIRHCPGAFAEDPLRLLRTFRFRAAFGFDVAQETTKSLGSHAGKIVDVATERINYELNLIFDSGRSAEVVREMHEADLLFHILPELYEGQGIEQPGFHHLDVFEHNLQTLVEIERVMANPESYYPGYGPLFAEYLEDRAMARSLKWAALLHDVAKPERMAPARGDEGRVTFYGHDEAGRDQVERIAHRLRWSRADRRVCAQLVAMHMHPFHLCTVKKNDKLSRKAALKLCNRAQEHLAGLFILAMADSLASRGELKPDDMEQVLAKLHSEVMEIYETSIKPVFAQPPLLTGKDLITDFGLEPGPLFSKILNGLQVAQVEGEVVTAEEAVRWVKEFIENLD